MKATRVFKSFDEMPQDQIAELTDPAESSAAAPMPMKESTQSSEARKYRPADDRELDQVQPFPRWGINE